MSNNPQLLGAIEAAKRLSIDRRTLYRYTLSGVVNATVKLPSGIYRYDESHITDLREKWGISQNDIQHVSSTTKDL